MAEVWAPPDTESLPIGSVVPPHSNARQHSEEQVQALVRSVAKSGQIVPLVVDGDGFIISGVGRHQAMLRLGYETWRSSGPHT